MPNRTQTLVNSQKRGQAIVQQPYYKKNTNLKILHFERLLAITVFGPSQSLARV